MKLNNINHLELVAEKDKNEEYVLDKNESTYIKNSENKIKKINDNEYMFMRFDYIKTHIEQYSTMYNLNDIYNFIVSKLDKNIKYAEDRMKLVNELLDENNWIYDIKSSSNIIAKEIKKKNSFLAENQKFDKLLDQISDYICFAKFKNEEDEKEYYELKNKEDEIKKLTKSNRKEHYDKLDKIINRIQMYPHELIKKSLENSSKIDENRDIQQHESMGNLITSEEQLLRSKRANFTYKKPEFDDAYWGKMYKGRNNKIPFLNEDKSVNAIEFRKEVMNQFKEDLNKLQKILGMNLPKENRGKHIEKLIDHLEENRNDKIEKICEYLDCTYEKAEKRVFSGRKQYEILKKMYRELKGDYEVSKTILSDQIEFNIKNHYTDYAITNDTWYEDDNGEIIELSKNRVLLNNASTYKGLILNYKDLKDKYHDKFNHDIWSLLFIFEELLEKTKFTDDEQFVLDMVFDNYTQKQIREKYEQDKVEKMTTRRISNLINIIIPNKILNTYLNSVDEWLYTYKIKGKYKKCTSCGDVKLISNDRYFRKDSLGRDGFRSNCRKCEILAKYRK